MKIQTSELTFEFFTEKWFLCTKFSECTHSLSRRWIKTISTAEHTINDRGQETNIILYIFGHVLTVENSYPNSCWLDEGITNWSWVLQTQIDALVSGWSNVERSRIQWVTTFQQQNVELKILKNWKTSVSCVTFFWFYWVSSISGHYFYRASCELEAH